MLWKLLIFVVQFKIVYSLTCEEILQLPSEQKLSWSELQSLQPKDVVECLAHLSKQQLPMQEAEFIWKSVKEFYDGIINIPEETLMLLHWATVAVSPEDYANITLSNIDVIENFGFNYNLAENQLAAIANKVREEFAGKEPEDYTYYDLTALRQILCAFNESEIARIHPEAYREAALTVGKLEQCNEAVMAEFANLAVQDQAFGSTKYWNENTRKIVGKLTSYLPKSIAADLHFRDNPV